MKIYVLLATLLSSLLFADMESDVANLKVGIGGYNIGQTFSKAEMKAISKKSIKTNTAGTIKFQENDLNIVIRERDSRIIIIYKLFSDSNRDTLETTISGLIFEFGDPTAISHSKILYWSYNKTKKITQEMFKSFKDEIAEGGNSNEKLSLVDFLDGKGVEKSAVQLNNIITVKLNSDKDIYSEEKIYNFYFILSANTLIQDL